MLHLEMVRMSRITMYIRARREVAKRKSHPKFTTIIRLSKRIHAVRCHDDEDVKSDVGLLRRSSVYREIRRGGIDDSPLHRRHPEDQSE